MRDAASEPPDALHLLSLQELLLHAGALFLGCLPLRDVDKEDKRGPFPFEQCRDRRDFHVKRGPVRAHKSLLDERTSAPRIENSDPFPDHLAVVGMEEAVYVPAGECIERSEPKHLQALRIHIADDPGLVDVHADRSILHEMPVAFLAVAERLFSSLSSRLFVQAS